MMKSKEKRTLFLSDFDGTMSPTEFYLLFVESYCKEEDKRWFNQCLKGEITSFEYLKNVLAFPQLTQQQFAQHITGFPLDSYVKPTVSWLANHKVDFAVTSAGCIKYLLPLLRRLELHDIEVFSNGGVMKAGHLLMPPAPEQFYEPYFGIDKAEVVAHLRSRYDYIIYAGDGSSDLEAAKAADMRFAKSSLAHKLRASNTPFFPFDRYSDILTKLKEEMHFFC